MSPCFCKSSCRHAHYAFRLLIKEDRQYAANICRMFCLLRISNGRNGRSNRSSQGILLISSDVNFADAPWVRLRSLTGFFGTLKCQCVLLKMSIYRLASDLSCCIQDNRLNLSIACRNIHPSPACRHCQKARSVSAPQARGRLESKIFAFLFVSTTDEQSTTTPPYSCAYGTHNQLGAATVSSYAQEVAA